MIDWDTFYEHPHDRGELTCYEWLLFVADFCAAGKPQGDDFLAFVASSPTWRDVPVYFFTNTVRSLLDTPSRL